MRAAVAKKRHRCAICGYFVKPGETMYRGDPGSDYENEIICIYCKEVFDEGFYAKVYYGGEKQPRIINAIRNDTKGEFKVKWIPTDPWRGYFEPESDSYVRIHEDAALAWSEDAEELEKFDRAFTEFLSKLGIRWARVITRTSNVFSAGYDLFVHKEDYEKHKDEIDKARKTLREMFRDPARFAITALTGKTDPKDFTPEDYAVALMALLYHTKPPAQPKD